MSTVVAAPRRRPTALAIVICIAFVLAGAGAKAAPRQGCQAIGVDSASCTFVVTKPSTIQVVAAAAQYWEVDISIGSFSGLCAFGRVGAALGQCFANVGWTVRALVRQGAILVQALPVLPAIG